MLFLANAKVALHADHFSGPAPLATLLVSVRVTAFELLVLVHRSDEKRGGIGENRALGSDDAKIFLGMAEVSHHGGDRSEIFLCPVEDIASPLVLELFWDAAHQVRGKASVQHDVQLVCSLANDSALEAVASAADQSQMRSLQPRSIGQKSRRRLCGGVEAAQRSRGRNYTRLGNCRGHHWSCDGRKYHFFRHEDGNVPEAVCEVDEVFGSLAKFSLCRPREALRFAARRKLARVNEGLEQRDGQLGKVLGRGVRELVAR